MYAFTTLLALTLALFAPAANAIDYYGYSSTVSCSGDSFYCSDGGAVCCSFPTGFGYSAQFDDLPDGSQGQGYNTGSSPCTSFLFSVFGPGTKCWNGGGARAAYLNWFYSPGRRAVERAEESANANCSTPGFFKYTDGQGAMRVIRVPENAAETIANLSLSQDYEALAYYETYSG